MGISLTGLVVIALLVLVGIAVYVGGLKRKFIVYCPAFASPGSGSR